VRHEGASNIGHMCSRPCMKWMEALSNEVMPIKAMDVTTFSHTVDGCLEALPNEVISTIAMAVFRSSHELEGGVVK
jgi:hypothetical protein